MKNPGLSRGLIVQKPYADPLKHASPNDPLGHPGYGPAFGGRLHIQSLCGEELNLALAIL
jgi:hypothetical protein